MCSPPPSPPQDGMKQGEAVLTLANGDVFKYEYKDDSMVGEPKFVE